jgi:hypothetical protein
LRQRGFAGGFDFSAHATFADPTRGQHKGASGKFFTVLRNHLFANQGDALKKASLLCSSWVSCSDMM